MEHVKDVLGKVRDGLQTHKGKWPVIAHNAGVSYSFIAHIASGHTKDPRISGVQRVYDALNDLNQ